MKLVIPPVEIDKEDPFKHDVLHRKEFATALMNLVSRINEGVVISLDAPWGEGKTTFVRMWQGLLQTNGIKSIYVDAFITDFVDDPFIAVASEITQFAEAEFRANKSKSEKLEAFKKSTSKVGGQLLTLAAKIGVKAATLGVIKDSDIEEFKEIQSDIAKGTSDLVGKLIEDRIASYQEEVQSISSFKKILQELASEINQHSNKPLIVIIDELDRCKPTYAVALVEKIKHLFSVENIVFVLVMHKVQLEESVRCVYGQNIDASTYLQKFITVECTLPKNLDKYKADDYMTYCQRLSKLHELGEFDAAGNLVRPLAILAKHMILSLRQIERVFTVISIFLGAWGKNVQPLLPVVAVLAITKVLNPKLYIALKTNSSSWKDVDEFIKFPNEDKPDGESRVLSYIGQWVKYCVFTDTEYNALDKEDQVREFEKILFTMDRHEIMPICCHYMDLGKVP
jgi:KAP family P-loop domain